METIFFGLIAIAAGLLFCFRGYLAFRIVIPVWGAFVGFSLGAGLVASIDNVGFLQTGLGWVVGIVLALVVALVAYLWFELAVALAMGSIGFSLGVTIVVALGVSWTWVIVLVGVVVGVLLAIAAIRFALPMLLLMVLGALGGATAITTGLMLLTGRFDAVDLGNGTAVAQGNDGWWWYALYIALAVAGLVVQLRDAERRSATLREAWAVRGAQPVR